MAWYQDLEGAWLGDGGFSRTVELQRHCRIVPGPVPHVCSGIKISRAASHKVAPGPYPWGALGRSQTAPAPVIGCDTDSG